MKNAPRVILIGLWILAISVFLMRFWQRYFWLPNPDTLPPFPKPLARWLFDSIDLPKGDVAILFGLGVSLIIVFILALVGWFLWRRIKALYI